MHKAPSPSISRIAAVALLCAAWLAAGCAGAAAEQVAGTTTGTAATAATATGPRTARRAVRHGPIPRALRTAESAAEDTIDLVLAGRRRQAVRSARTLKRVAARPAARVLRAAGAREGAITQFRRRADRVARLAPTAAPLEVALAANRAFALIPGFFALFESRVPAAVTALDHADFEAKLQAMAGHRRALAAAIDDLDRTWRRLRADVVRAGGARVAARFGAHVRRLRRLAAAGGGAPAAREAQHGLDLVDDIEAVYAR